MDFYKRFQELFDAKKFHAARRLLQSVEKETTDDAYTLFKLAEGYYRTWRNEKALDLALRAKEMHYQRFRLCSLLGSIYNGMRYFSDSISEYDTILNAGVQGMTADREDKLDVQEAQKLYSEAWLYKGWDLYAIGREDEALQCVKQHLALRKPGVKYEHSRKQIALLLRRILRYKQHGDGPIMDKKERHRFYDELKRLNNNDLRERYDMLNQQTSAYPGEYYLHSLLSDTCFKMGKKEECLQEAEKSMKQLGTIDNIVVFRYANALVLNEQYELALKQYKRIDRHTINDIAYDEHGEGLRYAKSIKNDTLFMKGICMKSLGKTKSGDRYIRKHIKQRHRGLPSIVSKKEVQQSLTSQTPPFIRWKQYE